MFDLQAIDDRPEPIDLRMYLSLDGEPLTGTWIYQWMPPPPSERQ
jgi:glucans biosynthesis protein